VRLELLGQETEIDKFLIERMMDPILHLARNAISHAIETPDERIAPASRRDGTIRLSATTAGREPSSSRSPTTAGASTPRTLPGAPATAGWP
jgi:hypothetical protein